MVSENVGVSEFYEYRSSEKNMIHVPVMLINPWYYSHKRINSPVFQYLSRYSSNSGSAISLTFYDAFLHALCEHIERHYLSYYFMNEMDIDQPLSFYELKIDQNTIFKKIKLLKDDYNIQIIYSQDFANVHFCVVVGHSSEHSMSLVGSGASLCKSTAITRAIDEFLQVQHLSSEKLLKIEKNQIKSIFSNNDKAVKLLRLMHGKYHMISYSEDSEHSKMSTTFEVTHMIISELNKIGFRVYYRVLSRAEDPFVVVSLFIPGFERFHHIRSGIMVTPQKWLQKYA